MLRQRCTIAANDQTVVQQALRQLDPCAREVGSSGKAPRRLSLRIYLSPRSGHSLAIAHNNQYIREISGLARLYLTFLQAPGESHRHARAGKPGILGSGLPTGPDLGPCRPKPKPTKKAGLPTEGNPAGSISAIRWIERWTIRGQLRKSLVRPKSRDRRQAARPAIDYHHQRRRRR